MNHRVLIFFAVLLWAGSLAAADDKSSASPARTKPPKLSEILFDAGHFKAALGKKALLTVDHSTGKVSPTLLQDIAAAGLNESTQFYPFPSEGIQPEPKKREVPEYPAHLRRKGVDGSARLLILIGADGKVGAIYCANSTHRDFALASAEALVRWRFSPATIQGTAVPVVVFQTMDFDS